MQFGIMRVSQGIELGVYILYARIAFSGSRACAPTTSSLQAWIKNNADFVGGMRRSTPVETA